MEGKTALLKDLLNKTKTESVLIFTRTKSRARSVALQLDRSGYKVTSLHGNLTQQKRQVALDGFRDGRYEIMVATDIAARGIDVTRISHVINYDMPSTAEAYTHRIGRTGRAAKTGDAFTFVTGQDINLAHSLKRVLGEKLEYRSVDGLTIILPTNQVNERNGQGGNSRKQSRTQFYPKTQTSRPPAQRSFTQANRSSWAQ
jgi:superfamily II DNA/RNA helicase